MRVPEANIFMDKLSGKDFNRPKYTKMLRKMRPGDLLVVKSVEIYYKRTSDKYCGFGHATSGYKADRKESDRHLCG